MPNEKVTLEVDVDELGADEETRKIEAASKLTELLAQYRTHAEQKKIAEVAMSPIKAEIFELINEYGEYEDESGYARITHRKAGVSYASAEVEKLARVWSESEDPREKTCGKLLLQNRKVKKAISFPTIK